MNVKPILFSGPMVRAILDGRKTQHREPIKGVPMFSPGYDREWRPHAVPPGGSIPDAWSWWEGPSHGPSLYHTQKLPYAVGDVRWVRETWATVNSYSGPGWAYRANGAFIQPDYDGENFGAGPSFNYEKYPGDYVNWYEDLLSGVECNNWSSSIHMPRWASRLTIVVTDVRVQRVQDLSEADAVAEGLSCLSKDDGRTWKWGIPDRDGWPGTDDDGWQWTDWDVDPRKAFARLWDSINVKRADGAYAWDRNPWVVAITFAVHQQNVDAYLAEREAEAV